MTSLPATRGAVRSLLSSVFTLLILEAFLAITQSWAGSSDELSVFANVPEALEEGYQVIYELDIPVDGTFRNSTPVPYAPNGFAPLSFDRVAYFLELTNATETKWVYVSMEAFTDDWEELGLPHNANNPVFFQQPARNMNVASNVPGIVTGTSMDDGSIEIWPSDYSTGDSYGVFAASDSLYDWGDGNASTSAGYGSFQVHNFMAGQTVLAYNRWGVGDGVSDDVGIGSQPAGPPDWTMAGNTATYSARKLVILVRPRTYDVTFNELPRDRQLFSRNLSTNRAAVPISGQEFTDGAYDRIVLKVFRNGILHSETGQVLHYQGGTAPFTFNTEILAELAKYDFELLLEKNGELKTIEQVRSVVAGDAYLFYGQSNAEAAGAHPDRSANEYASPWLLTFGQNGDNGTHAQNILSWAEAEGDRDRHGPGAIGQWAMVLGHEIIDAYQIPIAILNGSRGGYGIRRLQKDRDEPGNLHDSDNITRTYNRLRYRAIQAGVATTVRAMFFYHGEADNEKADRHADGFATLREDWADDYPGLERFYITQVRPGCGITATNLALRDVQRRFADVYPNTSVMASNGLENHDGCHFWFTLGYEQLGWNHFRLVARDLYGAPDGLDIDALNPALVGFTDSNRTALRLSFRKPARINFPNGALSDFNLAGSTATITGRTVEGDSILFQLSGPAPLGSVLEYRSHLGAGEWVTNANGVGMLSFAEPVTAISVEPNGTQLSGIDLDRLADGLEEATLTVQLRDESGNVLNQAGVEVVFETDLGAFPNGLSVSSIIETDSNGRAEVALVSTTTGQATVSATVNRAPIKNGSPVIASFGSGTISLTENGTLLHSANVSFVANGLDAATITVQLRDAFGNDIAEPNVAVDFATTLGQFSEGTSNTTALTDETGLATVTLTSTLTGQANVTAAIDNEAVTNGSVEVTFLAGAATHLVIETQPAAGASGEQLTTQPLISIRDAHGNLVSDDTTTEVEATIFSGTAGTLGGTTIRTANNGFVTFDDLALTGTAGESYVLNFADSVATLTPTQSDGVQLDAGPVTRIAFTTSEQTMTAGDTSETITVQLQDTHGNPATREEATQVDLSSSLPGTFRNAGGTEDLVFVSIAAGESNGSFRYSATVAGTHLLTAENATGAIAPASQQLAVTSEAATQIAFTTSEQTIAAGATSETITVQLQDTHGNPTTREEATQVDLSSSLPGTFRNAGDTEDLVSVSIATGESNASFRYNATIAGTHILGAAGTILPNAVNQGLTVTPGAAAQLAFQQQPTDTVINQMITPDVTVRIEDTYGNPVTDAMDEITLAIAGNPGNAILSGTFSQVPTNEGVARFADFKINVIASGYTLKATSAAGLADVTSSVFDIIAGAGFAAWAEVLTEGQRGEMDDPGGTGIENILRYAFGMDRQNPDLTELPRIALETIEVNGQPEKILTITYTRRIDDPGLTYTIEASETLVSWVPITGTETDRQLDSDATETMTTIDDTFSGQSRRFLRVTVAW